MKIRFAKRCQRYPLKYPREQLLQRSQIMVIYDRPKDSYLGKVSLVDGEGTGGGEESGENSDLHGGYLVDKVRNVGKYGKPVGDMRC
jgi:hypothetical protein